MALPGPPVPARRHPHRRRHELRWWPRLPTVCCCACSTPQGTRPRSRCRNATAASGTGSCPGSGPARPTATGSPDPTTRAAGCGATRPSCCSTPTPGRSTATCGSGPKSSATQSTTPTRPSTLDSAGHVPRSLVVDSGLRLERSSPARPQLRRHHHLRGPRQGLHRGPPDVPEELRGTYAGLAHDAAIAHLVDLGVTAVELLPVHHNVPESFLLERGLTNYWGYNTIGYLRPARRLLRRGPGRPTRRAGRRVPDHGRRPAHRRPGGAARRGVQPHRRGQPPRPHPVPPRAGQPRLLPPRSRRSAPLRRHHRRAATPSTPATRSPCS